MNLDGWIVMLVSTGGMAALLAWCLYKVLSTSGSEEHLHSPADIHPAEHDKVPD